MQIFNMHNCEKCKSDLLDMGREHNKKASIDAIVTVW